MTNDVKDTSSKAAAEDKNTERRIVALRLSEDDAALLRGALPLINGNLDGIVDAFCGHLLNYPDTRNTLRSRSRLEKLREGLKNYLEETFDCKLDRGYFGVRVNIAEQFDATELRPKSYLAAYGHLEGDIVLKKVAHCARKVLRQDIDFCCRYDGEEFTVILQETPKEGAIRVAKRLRKEAEALEFHPKTARDASKPLRMTISVGIAEFNNDDAYTLVDRADRAMYEAKRQGKNKVVISG